jgi:hypothetical protein
MSRPRAPRLPAKIRRLLNESGLAWDLRGGGRHFKLFVEGRLAAVVPRAGVPEYGRGLANFSADIHRAISRAQHVGSV